MTNRNTLNDKNNSLFETYQFSVISTWTWQTVTAHTCSIKLICIFRLQHKNRRLCSPDKIESFEADFDKTMNMTIEIFSCSHFLFKGIVSLREHCEWSICRGRRAGGARSLLEWRQPPPVPYSGQPTPPLHTTPIFIFNRFRYGLQNIQVTPPTVSRGPKVGIN